MKSITKYAHAQLTNNMQMWHQIWQGGCLCHIKILMYIFYIQKQITQKNSYQALRGPNAGLHRRSPQLTPHIEKEVSHSGAPREK